MKLFLDLNYHFFSEKNIDLIYKKYNANFGYLEHLKDTLNVISLFQTSFKEEKKEDNLRVIAHKGRSLKKIDYPNKIHKKILQMNPDYILIHGLRYGLYSFFIKRKLKNVVILVQVHGYAKSPSGIKKKLYQWAQKYVDGYLFTGNKNAQSWIDSDTIPERKIFEVMEGSINFPDNVEVEKEKNTFLWVGRLIASKDPILVLNAFEEYLNTNPLAKLEMVFNSYDLIDEVREKINKSTSLKNNVSLIGELDKKSLEKLYLKNQFFITGSHYEGSGYALLESMAYGCIPIITKIPSHEFMTGYGNCGFLYNVKNQNELVNTLRNLNQIDIKKEKEKVYNQFIERLSFRAIAEEIYTIFDEIAKNKGYV